MQSSTARCSASFGFASEKVITEIGGQIAHGIRCDPQSRRELLAAMDMPRERNTKFFHATVVDRRRRNRILQLKLWDGTWCTDEAHLHKIAYTFYWDLYSKETTANLEPHLWKFPKLPRGCLRWLNREVVDTEIRCAVFQLGRHKVPGPDGIPTTFYQTFWPVVGDYVVAFVKGIFELGIVLEQMNGSLICLIPKQTHPETISQFRPIYLGNVITKVISKVIANRLKPLMGDLVGQAQAGFIPGRQTSDNVVMAQELLYTIRHRKGRKGHMIVKVDFEKVYDRIDWSFFKQVLCTIGFGGPLIRVIMSCITSTNLSII